MLISKQDKTNFLENTSLRIAGAINDSIVDGTGIRYTIFTQGCLLNCKGCQNPQTHCLDGGISVRLKDLYTEIKNNPLLSGVTFSGGEPFLHSVVLAQFANILKQDGYNIWCYSGYVFEKLILNVDHRRLLENIDVLVDGPYIEKLRSLELDFRGSSNQRIIDVARSLTNNTVIIYPTNI